MNLLQGQHHLTLTITNTSSKRIRVPLFDVLKRNDLNTGLPECIKIIADGAMAYTQVIDYIMIAPFIINGFNIETPKGKFPKTITIEIYIYRHPGVIIRVKKGRCDYRMLFNSGISWNIGMPGNSEMKIILNIYKVERPYNKT